MKFWLILLTSLITMSANAADKTGRINTINFNQDWDAVLVQFANLDNTAMLIDPNCGNSSWGYLKVENKIQQSMLAAMLTAKTTNAIVRLVTGECANTSTVPGPIPVIQNLDFGQRQ